MQILEAYCEQSNEVLDIYDARDAYFSQPEMLRKRLTFRCSDSRCRSKFNPLVTGVNYHKAVEENETYVQPHFKSAAQHPHTRDCMWVHRDNQLLEMQPHQGGMRLSKVKLTDVIDAFDPRKQDSVSALVKVIQPTSDPAEIPSPVEGDRSISTATGLSRTSRLEKLVDCWSAMEFEKRLQNKVVLAGQEMPYAYAVIKPTKLRMQENGTRVIHGLVSAKFWPEDKPHTVYFNFADGCEKFTPVNDHCSLVIAIPLSRLEHYRGGGLILRRIEEGKKPGFYLKAYCWGEFVPTTNKGYKVDIRAMDNLVVKAVKKQLGVVAALNLNS